MRKRLIVVADNSLIVEAIRSGLHESGTFDLIGYIDVYNASTRLIAGAGADLVLMDEGDQSDRTIALIRSLKDEVEHVTIIVLTVRMEGEWLGRAFESGATGAISKAVHPSALPTLVRESISGHIVHPLTSIAGVTDAEKEVVGEQCALTDRELQVLQLVAAGATNGEVARQLWITQETVKSHVTNIYRKLDVANRTEACHYAHVNGLVAPGQPAILDLPTLIRETVSEHTLHRYKDLGQAGGRFPDALVEEHSTLTSRELEVLRLVTAGATNGEIGRTLWVTEQTVKFHLSNVYRKLDVANRTEASHYAHVNGLVSAPAPLAVS
jgi:DNA-binding NarL/FixJ family response regulator